MSHLQGTDEVEALRKLSGQSSPLITHNRRRNSKPGISDREATLNREHLHLRIKGTAIGYLMNAHWITPHDVMENRT